jgi:hypothetical protein
VNRIVERSEEYHYSSPPFDSDRDGCDNSFTMSKRRSIPPITGVLKTAIVDSGVSYKSLSKDTGVARASIQRFIDGRQSIRLDMADRLAAYFGLRLLAEKKPLTTGR